MVKRIVSILLIIFLLPTIAGCWDSNEINELGFVLCVAVDKVDNQYKVTAQVAKPEIYSKTPSGAGSTSEKEKPFWIISATGKTVFEAIRNMSVISPRRIFWAHIKVIIIGEKLARSDIHTLLDFFARNPENRFRTLVAVAPGEAGKLLEIEPMMTKDPATHLEKLIENKSLSGKGYRNMLKNFLEDYLDPNGNPVASRVMVSKNENEPVLEINGAAVFRKNKLAGWLDEKETKGLLWLKNEIKGSVMVIKCPYDGHPITIELKKGETSFKSSIKNGLPHYQVNVEATGILVEQESTTDFTDQKALNKLERTLALSIQNDIRSALKASQNMKVDFLELNEVLHRQHKKEWQHLSSNWPEVLAESTFAINVKSDIPSVSVLAKPVAPNPYHALEQE